jgi:hypothetical protein
MPSILRRGKKHKFGEDQAQHSICRKKNIVLRHYDELLQQLNFKII